MFTRLSLESARMPSSKRCACVCGNIMQRAGIRWESSINFQNNQMLQKQSLKQSKMKSKRSKKKDEVESGNDKVIEMDIGTEGKSETGMLSKEKKIPLDYSWLPRVPSTEHIPREEFNSDVLYSGYRPIYISEKNAKEDKLMQFAMKLEKLGEPVPWVSSATGQEFYSEWDNIPTEVVKDLKPFHPPNVNMTPLKDNKSNDTLKREILVREQDKLINRKKGRKKPILRVLELKKKFKLE